jgi:hypothetical protein
MIKQLINYLISFTNITLSKEMSEDSIDKHDLKITTDLELYAYKNLKECIDKWKNDTCFRLLDDIKISRRWALVNFILMLVMLTLGIGLWHHMFSFIADNQTTDFLTFIMLRSTLFASVGLGTIIFYMQYKNKMSEINSIRYELTNIESKYRVWQFAIEIGDRDMIIKALKEILKINNQSNFENIQTAIELKQKKVDDNLFSEIIKSILKIGKIEN